MISHGDSLLSATYEKPLLWSHDTEYHQKTNPLPTQGFEPTTFRLSSSSLSITFLEVITNDINVATCSISYNLYFQ